MRRRPAVAGQFYSASSSGLSREVKKYIETSAVKEKAIGAVSPHAGLMYSGAVAGAVYSRIEFPRTFVLIGPNHTGIGRPLSIMSSGQWDIPMGSLKIDEVLAGKILDRSEIIEEDSSAHSSEHSLEVQLPFILYFSTDVKIVPITMMADSLDSCRLVGRAVAEAIKDTEDSVTIVASSDMSHYEADAVTRAKDKEAIDRVQALDPKGLYNTVRKKGISMCGFAPATAMLYAANELGAQKSTLIKYMTSGDVSGDYNYVVGYAGILIQ